jgi:tetratricopeptide (TPR) repeat protein
MSWLVLFAFALMILCALWRFAHVRGFVLELAGAAVFLGVAGYAWQGSPTLPGSPTPPPAETRQPDSLFALERNKFLERFTADAQLLDAADAMHRNGLESYAIALIRGGLEKRPQSADLWLGMGNALTLYAGGMITPAAQLAFERARAIAPNDPGPAYFAGLAYAQSGQIDRARAIWTDLLAKAPLKAPWRATVEQRLIQLQQVR